MSILDVAVIGAGPAGLAAAALGAARGLQVTLYDEQRGPGGAIYRGITASPLADTSILDADYWHGATLVDAFEHSGVRRVSNALVWGIERGDSAFTLSITHGVAETRATVQVTARAVIIATGAIERPMPVPGWTLPGVMTAGAAQILLKTAAAVPRGRTTLAGCGPLLWLVAAQFLRAGVTIERLLDTTPRGRLRQALRHAPQFILSPYFAKGRALVREVRRQVDVVEHVESLAIDGSSAAQSIRYASGGIEHTHEVEHVLLHQGVVPDINLAQAAGCALDWNDAQASFAPVVDDWGGTSVPGLFIAGDASGIGGARAAEAHGRIVALAVENALGRGDAATRDRLATPHRRQLAGALRGRAFIDALYRPADAFRLPGGDTVVCRCEEVTAATVIALARNGCAGPNQMKAFTRCGMGSCQGRFCGSTVTEIIAREQGRTPGAVGYYRTRYPVKPITLGDMAAVPGTAEAIRAVDRWTN